MRLDLKEIVLKSTEKKLFQRLEQMVLVSTSDVILEHQLNEQLTGPSKEALGLLLYYLKDTQQNDLEQFNQLEVIEKDAFLKIDHHSRLSLELTDTQNRHKGATLIDILDHCVTALGSRLVRKIHG